MPSVRLRDWSEANSALRQITGRKKPTQFELAEHRLGGRVRDIIDHAVIFSQVKLLTKPFKNTE
ncbi:hypothetical protein [Vibrio gallaecicus]|uniref:hypothetical protein n=1 Tax=Vibrio gallaecicus TaxID=552386 RepID=UPI0025B5FA02|nr:hypothetical protein [Vibrio gallaecicus]MDN3614893.1 hypothetical protein [Vibrio gallaecicus]